MVRRSKVANELAKQIIECKWLLGCSALQALQPDVKHLTAPLDEPIRECQDCSRGLDRDRDLAIVRSTRNADREAWVEIDKNPLVAFDQ